MIFLDLNHNKNFYIGNVLKVYYIIVLKMKKKKKKASIFVGLCINYNNYFLNLVNVIKKEKIFLNFDIRSPFIYKVEILNKYKKMIYRVSKLYFKTNNYYFDEFDDFLTSNIENFKYDFFFSAYLKKKIIKKKKKLKKFKRKYTHTENWKNLKEEILAYEEDSFIDGY